MSNPPKIQMDIKITKEDKDRLTYIANKLCCKDQKVTRSDLVRAGIKHILNIHKDV